MKKEQRNPTRNPLKGKEKGRQGINKLLRRERERESLPSRLRQSIRLSHKQADVFLNISCTIPNEARILLRRHDTAAISMIINGKVAII